MMWHEFEQLAGYEVSYEDYVNIIEPMYMATNLSKKDFIAALNRKRFEKEPEWKRKERLLKAMKKETQKAEAQKWSGNYTAEAVQKITELAKEYWGCNNVTVGMAAYCDDWRAVYPECVSYWDSVHGQIFKICLRD